jgi:hypothetical protein
LFCSSRIGPLNSTPQLLARDRRAVAQLGPGDFRMDAPLKPHSDSDSQGCSVGENGVVVCNRDPNFQVLGIPKTSMAKSLAGEGASYLTDLRFRARKGRFPRWRRATVFQNSSCDTPLPALMLLRDLLSKDCKRREWANISRSKSSSSLGASNIAAALPLRVIMTGPSFSHSST